MLGEDKDESPELCSYYSTVVLCFITAVETFELFWATENYSKIDLKKIRGKKKNTNKHSIVSYFYFIMTTVLFCITYSSSSSIEIF